MAEINGAIKTEKNAKLKKVFQEIVAHLKDLKKKKEAVLAQMKKDNDVEKAIQSIIALMKKHKEEVDAFHEKMKKAQ